MYKLVDSTFVFAVGQEIRSVELLPRICSRYELVSTEEVFSESLKKPFPGQFIDIIGETDGRYTQLFDHIKRRHPQLHKGEISIIAASLLMGAEKTDNYIVTDDGFARKTMAHVSEDPRIGEILGKAPASLKYTGTIGIIRRLKTHGLISPEECHLIAKDLRDSSFNITEKLLSQMCT